MKTRKKNLSGFYKCRNMINEQIGVLKSLVADGEINIDRVKKDKTLLFDYVDRSLVGNLMKSPVWKNTLYRWLVDCYPEECNYINDYYNWESKNYLEEVYVN